MKAVDRVGNTLGVGSIVLGSGSFKKADPIFDYRIIATTEGNDGLRLLCPTVKTLKGGKQELTCAVATVRGEIMKDSTGLVVRFKNLLVATNVPESLSTQLYQAVLNRAAKPRGG